MSLRCYVTRARVRLSTINRFGVAAVCRDECSRSYYSLFTHVMCPHNNPELIPPKRYKPYENSFYTLPVRPLIFPFISSTIPRFYPYTDHAFSVQQIFYIVPFEKINLVAYKTQSRI